MWNITIDNSHTRPHNLRKKSALHRSASSLSYVLIWVWPKRVSFPLPKIYLPCTEMLKMYISTVASGWQMERPRYVGKWGQGGAARGKGTWRVWDDFSQEHAERVAGIREHNGKLLPELKNLVLLATIFLPLPFYYLSICWGSSP